MSFNNSVYENGEVVGFRCRICDQVKSKMWGDICNECRERRDLPTPGLDGVLQWVKHMQPAPAAPQPPPPTGDIAHITPTVLTWAIARLGIERSRLAQQLSTDVSTIEAWESGAQQPTFDTAQRMAEILVIPFGFFWLSKPPAEDIPLVQDHRSVVRDAIGMCIDVLTEFREEMTPAEQTPADSGEAARPAQGTTALTPETLAQAVQEALTKDVHKLATRAGFAAGPDESVGIAALNYVLAVALWPKLAPLVAGATWQPIETCPRGRIVLMFAVTDRHPDGRVANWKKATGHLATHDGSLTWDGDRVDKPYMHRPTHWMPLPASPPDDPPLPSGAASGAEKE